MFHVKDNAITPLKAQLQRAVDNFEGAHIHAQQAGAEFLRDQVAQAAEANDLPSSPIGVMWDKGHARVGIDDSDEGNQLFDAEFGTPDQPANSVLRVAHRQALPAAKGVYAHHLIRELGNA